jgi:uncharacterized membrane protein
MIDELPLHPALVHLPIGIAFLLPLLALGIATGMWRQWLPKSAWLIVCLTSGLGVATGFSAANQGEVEERRVESFVSKAAIHEHEDAADTFVWSLVAMTVVASAAFFALKSQRVFQVASLVLAVMYFVPLAAALNAGRLGGKLVFELGAGNKK